MTTPDAMSDGLAAALIQISAHAERISSLDAREAGHFEQVAATLRDLASKVTTSQSRQEAILASLDDLDAQVAKLATHLADLAAPGEEDGDTDRYQPVPPPRWWKLSGPERETALDRLRAWVEQIYRPGYGQLAATLPPCWERHPVCLYTLDWLSELWSVLYLASQRDGPSSPPRLNGTPGSCPPPPTRCPTRPAAAITPRADAVTCPASHPRHLPIPRFMNTGRRDAEHAPCPVREPRTSRRTTDRPESRTA